METAAGSRSYYPIEFIENKAEVTLKTGESAYILGVPKDTVLTVTEIIASGALYAVESITVDGKEANNAVITVAADKITTAEFVNTKVVDGDLAITKKVESVHPEHKNKDFAFVVTLENPVAENPAVKVGDEFETVKSDGTPGTVTVTEGENGALVITGITLKADETLTIEGIPNGVKAIVEEIEVENDGFTSDKVDDGNKVELNIVIGQTQAAEFTNTYAPSSTETSIVINGEKNFTYDGAW